ncbi:hypothetical protein FXB85_09465 [Aggregatibacter actinomycetemcomitans]|nr:hypothetical protein FXB85_09465 [Aggregatibacter actinomycetemcomitans]
MFKTLSKLISSSISMAFLVVLGWSTAYAYGWGQSYFYGFPWWYVDVGVKITNNCQTIQIIVAL